MDGGQWVNGTPPVEFLLLGMSDDPSLQTLPFILSLVIYTVTVFGNILIVVLVMADQHLRTPMYFFLDNLSSLEICYSSTILSRLLASFLTGDKTISAHGCMAQFYFFSTSAGTECYLLAAMPYNQYLAICQPLLYASHMTWKVSLQLAAASWLGGLLLFAVLIFLLFQLKFYSPKAIDHFCDFTPLMELSCSDTNVLTGAALIFVFLDAVFPFLFTLASYVFIIAAILRIPSHQGRQKAFSTCSSHLTVVTLFYGTLIIVYMLPRTTPPRQLNKVFSFFYTVLTPLINALISSLRNREVREALWKVLRKAKACTQNSWQVVTIWDAVSAYILGQLKLDKGVLLPGLGTFTMVQERFQGEEEVFMARRPVFQLNMDKACLQELTFPIGVIPEDGEIKPLNYR
ncbi:olfactory receptor 5B21-like [Rissa tridactyla]|uniref:olfactory receptor 5B21-like n=1 Tax=Rissa tridactyla TaxID=75485 RepID=UPI0023BABF90|nr:olfactory receptor 5B21-like [Rissa tridactyla]